MLHLPSVTLMGIDVARPISTISALQESMRWCSFGSVVLLADLKRHGSLLKPLKDSRITIHHHEQSDNSVQLPGRPHRLFYDYERAQMVEPSRNIGQSTHVLYMESDAGVLNPSAWNPFWLSYDYIGAPWPTHTDPGYPPCDGVSNAVGNSGFSLRSKKFCESVVKCLEAHPKETASVGSDSWLCRTKRPWLERECGVRFAPVDVASKFSCENRIYDGSFGFHGRGTAEMNGWGGWLGSLYRK